MAQIPPVPGEYVLVALAVFIGLEVLSLASVPSVLVQRAGRPMSALSWILGLLAFPPGGLLLWWLLGRTHLRRARRKRRAAVGQLTEKLTGLRSAMVCPSLSSTTRMFPMRTLPAEFQHAVFPATCGNSVTLLHGAQQAYPQMMAAARTATHHIHMLFYTWNRDSVGTEFLDLLAQQARRGIQVRILCDAMGSPDMTQDFAEALVREGGQVGLFLPPRWISAAPTLNFRNHRKLMIVDGKLGFTGGINIGDEYLGDWLDLAVRLTGPVADQLQEVFADDWYFATGENLAEADYFGQWEPFPSPNDASCSVIASGPDALDNAMHDSLFMALNAAQTRIFILTPYFIPSLPILTALRTSVFRGVDVRLMVPANSDVPLVRYAARSFYADLIRAGVRIFELQGSMLHAKALILDQHLALIGSANMDNRSFRLNFEASTFIESTEFNRSLSHVFHQLLANCRELSQEDVDRQRWSEKVIDAAAHLLSPVL